MSSSSSSSGSSSPTSSLTSNAVAAAFVNPFSTVAVRSHVPVTLEFTNPNYSKWAGFFKTMCGKFGLLHHIDGTDPHPDDPAWAQADYAVKSWIQCSIADDVLDLATLDEDMDARALWVAVKGLFLDNQESRAIFLHNEFHSLVQGDQTISAYCTRMKRLADSLRDVGHAMSDPQLVLNLLRGLPPTATSVSSDASVIQTRPRLPLTNSPLAPPLVSSWVTPLRTRVIDA